VVECLPSKHKTLSLNPSATKTNKHPGVALPVWDF
jgi:hypothetical protein